MKECIVLSVRTDCWRSGSKLRVDITYKPFIIDTHSRFLWVWKSRYILPKLRDFRWLLQLFIYRVASDIPLVLTMNAFITDFDVVSDILGLLEKSLKITTLVLEIELLPILRSSSCSSSRCRQRVLQCAEAQNHTAFHLKSKVEIFVRIYPRMPNNSLPFLVVVFVFIHSKRPRFLLGRVNFRVSFTLSGVTRLLGQRKGT